MSLTGDKIHKVVCDVLPYPHGITILLLQSKPQDGEKGEHKSKGEEEGEEADGDEDEFGVRIGFMIKATYSINID